MSLQEQVRFSLTRQRHSGKNRQTSMVSRLSKDLGVNHSSANQPNSLGSENNF
jgi:hypothetical protein